MKYSFASLMPGIALFATVVIPPLGMAFGAVSMSPGVLAVSLLVILSYIVLYAIHKPPHELAKVAVIVFLVMLIVAVPSIPSYLINANFDIARFLKSCLLLVTLIVAAYSFVMITQALTNTQVDFAVRLVFWVLLLMGTAGIFHYSPLFNTDLSVLLFSEKSHYALALLPFILYMVILSSPNMKKVIIAVALLLTLLLQNITLLTGILFIALFAFPVRKYIMFSVIAVITLAVTSPKYFDYYFTRLQLSAESNNASVLVFVSGWERTYLNMIDTFGTGVGFQQFGIVGNRGSIFERLARMGVPDQNLLDGSTVASKLVSELGVIGLILILVYAVFFSKSVKTLYQESMKAASGCDPKNIFFLSCFVMFFSDLFIRGTGYFSSYGFLFMSSILWVVLYGTSGIRAEQAGTIISQSRAPLQGEIRGKDVR